MQSWLDKETKVGTQKISFVGIQESNVTDPKLLDVEGCCGSIEFECEIVNSCGKSGRLLYIWEKRLVN